MSQSKPFAEWIGRASESEDTVTERLAASFVATFAPALARVGEGEAPVGIHWCLSPAIEDMSVLGADGHPARNRDLPPVPQPRRMWAGGAVESLLPLRVGERVRRRTTIGDVVRKEGRSGELWFVKVLHDYECPRGLAIRERHDIVYREAAGASKGAPSRPPVAPAHPAAESWTVETTPTLLFRYSAMTFNGHRIHYDLAYAREAEGYDGLVVHGPLQATLLINLAAHRLGAAPRHFEYRALAAPICGHALTACAGAGEAQDLLWTQGPAGGLHMEARIRPS